MILLRVGCGLACESFIAEIGQASKVTLGYWLSMNAFFLYIYLNVPFCSNDWTVPPQPFHNFLPNIQPLIPSIYYQYQPLKGRSGSVFLDFLLTLLNVPLEHDDLVKHCKFQIIIIIIKAEENLSQRVQSCCI